MWINQLELCPAAVLLASEMDHLDDDAAKFVNSLDDIRETPRALIQP